MCRALLHEAIESWLKKSRNSEALAESSLQKIDSSITPESSASEPPQQSRNSQSRTASPTRRGSPPLTTKISFPTIREHPNDRTIGESIPFTVSPPTPAGSNSIAQAFSSSPPSHSGRPNLRTMPSKQSSSKSIATVNEAPQGRSPSSGAPGATQQARNKERDRDKDKDRDLGVPGGQASASPKEKRTGFLGILANKKGRDKSPRRENGVLGKEGARIVISEG